MSTVAEGIAAFAANIDSATLPSNVRATCMRLLEDFIGLAFAARHRDYVAATLATATPGPCNAIGQARRVSVYDAALINGTAAHGEDYDDTFEGGPVHSGAVIVPAVLG
ncbi:MAG: MmgE/PrpD family protein, partial [Gammaproteobacteria bacterium]